MKITMMHSIGVKFVDLVVAIVQFDVDHPPNHKKLTGIDTKQWFMKNSNLTAPWKRSMVLEVMMEAPVEMKIYA